MNIVDALNTGYSHSERDAETYAFMGGDLHYENIVIPQPVAGIIPLLEQHDSPYLNGELGSKEDLALAVYFLVNREKAIANVEDIIDLTGAISDIDGLSNVILGMFSRSMAGFSMIPSSGDPTETNQRHFDAEWLAMIVSSVCTITNKTDFEAIWRVPLTAVGFYVAQNAKNNGVKGVGRERDYKAAIELLRKRREQENKGK